MKALKLKIEKMNQAIVAYEAASENASELCSAISFDEAGHATKGGDEFLAAMEEKRKARAAAVRRVKAVAADMGFSLKLDIAHADSNLERVASRLAMRFDMALEALHSTRLLDYVLAIEGLE